MCLTRGPVDYPTLKRIRMGCHDQAIKHSWQSNVLIHNHLHIVILCGKEQRNHQSPLSNKNFGSDVIKKNINNHAYVKGIKRARDKEGQQVKTVKGMRIKALHNIFSEAAVTRSVGGVGSVLGGSPGEILSRGQTCSKFTQRLWRSTLR